MVVVMKVGVGSGEAQAAQFWEREGEPPWTKPGKPVAEMTMAVIGERVEVEVGGVQGFMVLVVLGPMETVKVHVVVDVEGPE